MPNGNTAMLWMLLLSVYLKHCGHLLVLLCNVDAVHFRAHVGCSFHRELSLSLLKERGRKGGRGEGEGGRKGGRGEGGRERKEGREGRGREREKGTIKQTKNLRSSHQFHVNHLLHEPRKKQVFQ